MKTIKILSLLAIIFSFSQCGTTKFDKNPPFEINTASYKNWVGGQPGVGGTKVEITLKEKSGIAFDSLFFNKMKTKIEKLEMDGETFLIGHFNTSTKRNLVLHLDPRKEIKNEVPKKINFPFELKENEVIISYKVGTKVKYYKVENIKKTKQQFFPSANKK